MTTHLVIGDAHSKPGVSNERFEWLGRLCLDRRPDVIIDIGDWADMESLCSYDKGTKSFEGRRYAADCAAARDARQRFDAPIAAYNDMRARNGKKQYRPRKVSTLGNHEHRIVRAVEMSPNLEGALDLQHLGAETYGWEVHPFLEIVNVDGVHYSHYHTSGVMGRPVGMSGEHPASQTLKKKYVSCTSGHIHVRDFTERARADGTKILGLVAGCYFEHMEPYAGPANDMWWRGVVLCHNVENGEYDPEFISIERVREMYS